MDQGVTVDGASVSTTVAVPPRSIDSLMNLANANPASRRAKTRAKRIDGGVAVEASVEGTFDKPAAVVRAYGLGLKQLDRKSENKPDTVRPLDAALYATYDGKRADIGVTVVDLDRTSLQGAGTVVFSTAELVANGQAPLIASADVRANRLRLGALPFVGDVVKGDLDAFSVSQLDQRIVEVLDRPGTTEIELDLAGMEFVDAAAASHLRRMHRLAADSGCALTIGAATRFAWWLFGSIGLTSVFPAPRKYRQATEPGS
jgi:ABC-type transporter Mla MlaB component